MRTALYRCVLSVSLLASPPPFVSNAVKHNTLSLVDVDHSFQTFDSHGSSVSFVNSNYMGFGTGIVPTGCGFTLQNRACGFYFEEGVNGYEGGKRPYHTIIPAMVTRPNAGGGGDDFVASLSNMGGFMQPQGHLQLMLNMFGRRGLNAQEAVDEPRFCLIGDLGKGAEVAVEEGFRGVEGLR